MRQSLAVDSFLFLGMAMCDVTRILGKIEAGDPLAPEQLLTLIYDELRKLAAEKMAQEKPGQTLQATALVHEAYIRLVDADEVQHWNSRGHFFTAAAEAMRRILVDRAREKSAEKRGGDLQRVELDERLAGDGGPGNVLELHEALTTLEEHDVDAAKLVKLRFFAGLTHTEAAEAMGVSRRVADRLWMLARTWLYRQISGV